MLLVLLPKFNIKGQSGAFGLLYTTLPYMNAGGYFYDSNS